MPAPNSFLLDLLTLVQDTGNPLETVSWGLFQNDVTPGSAAVFADFTAATFSGYAAKTAQAFTGPFLTGDLEPYIQLPPGVFSTASTVAVANTIYGIYVFSGTDLLHWKRLPAPVAMDVPLKAIQFTPKWSPRVDEIDNWVDE